MQATELKEEFILLSLMQGARDACAVTKMLLTFMRCYTTLNVIIHMAAVSY